ncbi:MAG: hypothetical protein GWO87_00540 [Xanthomonadaceae bacterium]|nr:hypothetical protein [Rhodospirillaceae bacterium]NIA17668.1 hypothetical protein [Xanthomonadaceae bacterium]
MDFTVLILFIIALFNLILAVFVFLNNRTKLVNIFFGITVLGCSMWNLGMGFYRIGNIETINFWGNFVYFAIDFTVVFFLYFSFVFPKGEFPKNFVLRFFLIFPPIVIFLISLIPGSIITKNIVEDSEIYTTVGWGYFVHSFITVVYFFWAFLNLIMKYKKARGIIKNQLVYLFFGTSISVTIGIITNVILFFITTEYNWIGPAATVIMVSFIAYAILRYSLMDIRIVIRQSAIILSTLLSIILIFLIIIGLYDYLSGFNISYTLLIILIFIFVITVLLFLPIKNFFERISNKYFFASLYNEEQILQNLIKEIPRVLDIKHLINLIVDTIKNTLQIEKVVLWSFDMKNKKFVALKPTDCNTKEMEGFIKSKFLKNYFSKSNLFIMQEAEYALSHELVNINNRDKNYFLELISKMKKQEIEIALPLVVKKSLIGFLFLGRKIDNAVYNKQDIDMLKIIANQSAAALENALLYEETKNFNIKMKEEVKRATGKLRKANKELKKLDKVKSEFISIASHQLRTPITIIKGYVSMLLEGDYGKINKKANSTLQQTYKSAQHMARLVEDFLNISRIESGKIVFDFKKEKFDALVKETAMGFEEIAKTKNLKINLDIQKNLPVVLVDKVKIKEVVSNLIDNAIKYTKQGAIIISLKLIKEENKKFLLLSIADNGIGISKEDISNIFKKFIRGKKVSLIHTEGLGLGLYFSKKVVEAHHGKIWVESKGENKGSVFYVRLVV